MLASKKSTPEPVPKLGCHTKVSQMLGPFSARRPLRFVGIKRRLEFRLDLLVEQP